MMHSDTELRLISEEIGYGIFASRLIPKGTITWALDALDLVLSPEAVAELMPLQTKFIERYAYIDDNGRYILCWDIGKYCNHSCHPTTVPLGAICDVAVCDIHCGEEITCDYGTLNIRKDLLCRCQRKDCRKIVRSSDLISLAGEIDRNVAELVPLMRTVSQPLLKFMVPLHRSRVESILAGRTPIPSCMENECSSESMSPCRCAGGEEPGGLWMAMPGQRQERR
ncbi:SET domain protein [uncultured archaeon]|nr:SET domain protein [uncultured archaeon]